MLQATQRKDLTDCDIPASDGKYYNLYGKWYDAMQPDKLDSEEFNVIVKLGHNNTLRFNSVDLDFNNVMHEYSFTNGIGRKVTVRQEEFIT